MTVIKLPDTAIFPMRGAPVKEILLIPRHFVFFRMNMQFS